MESKLKCYYDSSCTKELTVVDGVYVIPETHYVSYIENVQTLTLYIKNVGDSIAYNITVSTNSSLDQILNVQFSVTQLSIGGVSPIILTYNIPKYKNIDSQINLVIDYDNLP